MTDAPIDRSLAPGRHRRPSGEPPPLPRDFDHITTVLLLGAASLVAVLLVISLVPGLAVKLSVLDGRIEMWIASLGPAGPGALSTLQSVLFTWSVPLVAWSTLLALFAARRIRRAILYFASLIVTSVCVGLIEVWIQRPLPYGVTITGRWQNWTLPDRPLAMATAALVGAYLCLVPRGRLRPPAQIVVTLCVAASATIGMLLGVATPLDEITAIALGASLSILTFRLFAPEDLFPVGFGAGNAAHLDLGGERGDAICTAVETQLGLRVTEVKPIGDEGSAGSTPMLLSVVDAATGDDRGRVFAKLLAGSHLRSDRSYKLIRTLMYGRLEDEYRFSTVRRLVQQEDYLGLRMAAAGIAVPETFGIVEITPEREYLLVTGFLAGYEEIGNADIDDAVITGGLALVRRMWDTGLAHRDVKPANLMVHGDRISFIDVGFSQVRPSPWRQAVDLANIMLVLALRSDSTTVYERALQFFTPDDIGEAFAATQGMTVPTQLRREITRDGRDLIAEFRTLAPPCPPIKIQRWTFRRVMLTLGVIGTAVGLVIVTILGLSGTGLIP